jgi:hypothetical protein
LESSFGSGTAKIVRVVQRHRNIIKKGRTEKFDGAARSVIVRVASDNEFWANRSCERSQSAASVQGIAMTAIRSRNLETDMSGAEPDVIRIAYAQVDVTDINLVHNDSIMIKWHKSTGSVTGNDLGEA